MNDFLEKWKNDKKYRTKIKLLAYTGFVVIVSIYALSINGKTPSNNNQYNNFSNFEFTNNTFDIPKEYTYKINVNIDDNTYVYSGKKTNSEETIKKEENIIPQEKISFKNSSNLIKKYNLTALLQNIAISIMNITY